MEAAKRLAEAEKERKHLARQREVERSEKVEKSRKETERLLANQQAEIDKKKVRCHRIITADFQPKQPTWDDAFDMWASCCDLLRFQGSHEQAEALMST